jgi:hypothetical protein
LSKHGMEDDEEFYVDEDTGECQNLKPIYAANVGGNVTNIALAAYKTTSDAGGSVVTRQWMCQELVRFCEESNCNFLAAYGALVFCRFEWDAAVETFPNGACSEWPTHMDNRLAGSLFVACLKLFVDLVKGPAKKNLDPDAFQHLRAKAQRFSLWGDGFNATEGELDEILADSDPAVS